MCVPSFDNYNNQTINSRSLQWTFKFKSIWKWHVCWASSDSRPFCVRTIDHGLEPDTIMCQKRVRKMSLLRPFFKCVALLHTQHHRMLAVYRVSKTDFFFSYYSVLCVLNSLSRLDIDEVLLWCVYYSNQLYCSISQKSKAALFLRHGLKK